MSLTEEKQALRKEIKTRFNIFSEEALASESRAILLKLEQDPVFVNANTVLLYWSLPHEVETHGFIEHWSKKKKILLPVIVEDRIEAHLYEGTENMQTGKYNIAQPVTKEYNEGIDLAIIPGQAFDLKGHRLGRGKGFYDRFLQSFKGGKIGLCFHFQLADYIPFEDFDIPMDKVIAG